MLSASDFSDGTLGAPSRRARLKLPKRLRALRGSLAATAGSVSVEGKTLLAEVATDLFVGLDTPISLSCEILLRNGEYAELLQKNRGPPVV
jgi:hypothetical protein